MKSNPRENSSGEVGRKGGENSDQPIIPTLVCASSVTPLLLLVTRRKEEEPDRGRDQLGHL